MGTSSLWWLPALLQRAEVRCSIETSFSLSQASRTAMLQRAEVRCSIETGRDEGDLPLSPGGCSARKCAALLRLVVDDVVYRRRFRRLQRAEVRCSIETIVA